MPVKSSGPPNYEVPRAPIGMADLGRQRQVTTLQCVIENNNQITSKYCPGHFSVSYSAMFH